MNLIIVLHTCCIAVLSVGLVAGECDTLLDPCLVANHVELDDASRSTGHVFTNQPESDFSLGWTWYRSVSGAGGDMPLQPALSRQCNAYAPIWINDNLPPVGPIVNLAACATWFTHQCFRQYIIPVKNCGGFRVYCLKPTKYIYDRYCMGAETPCPAGTSSSTRFTPGCSNQDLSLTADPVITVGVEYDLHFGALCVPYYTFSCDVTHGGATVVIDVQWYADGTLIQAKTGNNAIPYNNMPSTINSKLLIANGFKLGTTLTCRVAARAAATTGSNVGAARETSFYAGFVVADSSQFIELEEGGAPGTYSAAYTIPFRCQYFIPQNQPKVCTDTFDCGIDIGVATVHYDGTGCAPDGDPITVRISDGNTQGCLVDTTEWGFSMSVNANPDHQYNSLRQQVLQLQVRNHPNPFFAKAYLPRAHVTIRDTDVMLAGKHCVIEDDPHQISFDGTTWTEVQLEGAFLMYKHKTLPISVEVYFIRPWPGATFTKNCGGAVRCGGEVFVYDDCRASEPRRITLYECDEGLQNMIVTQESNTQYKITLPTGTVVILGRSKQFVYPSIFDWEQTEGLCGNLNGIDSPLDDKIIRGTTIPDMGTPNPTWSTRKDYNAFSNSYRIPDSEKLYFGYVRDNLVFDDIYFCSCTGGDAGASCSVTPNVDCVIGDWQALAGNGHRCTLSKRRRKRTAGRNQDAYVDDQTPAEFFPIDENFVATPRGWTNGWTLDTATAHCHQFFTANKAVQACSVIPNLHYQGSIDNCIVDIFITGTTNHTQTHTDVVIDLCMHEVEKYSSQTPQDPGTPGQPTTPPLVIPGLPLTPEQAFILTSQLCPGSCSGHGRCSMGVCNCDQGYTDVDCSLDMNRVPILFDLPFGGVCNRSEEICNQTSVFADQFIPNSVYCKLLFTGVNPRRPVLQEIVTAEYIHGQKILCATIPVIAITRGDNILGDYTVNISASNDGQRFSDVKQLTIYQ